MRATGLLSWTAKRCNWLAGVVRTPRDRRRRAWGARRARGKTRRESPAMGRLWAVSGRLNPRGAARPPAVGGGDRWVDLAPPDVHCQGGAVVQEICEQSFPAGAAIRGVSIDCPSTFMQPPSSPSAPGVIRGRFTPEVRVYDGRTPTWVLGRSSGVPLAPFARSATCSGLPRLSSYTCFSRGPNVASESAVHLDGTSPRDCPVMN